MLDGRTKYEQILGVLHVPASVKQLLADAHSTTSQLHVVRPFWILAAFLSMIWAFEENRSNRQQYQGKSCRHLLGFLTDLCEYSKESDKRRNVLNATQRFF